MIDLSHKPINIGDVKQMFLKNRKNLKYFIKYCHNPRKGLGVGPNFGRVASIVIHLTSIQVKNR